MNEKTKLILVLVSILFAFIAIQIFFFFEQSDVNRSESSLFNQYFKLQRKDPEGAKRTLEVILEHNPRNQLAQRELAYWYLRQGDVKRAIEEFTIAHKNDPNDILSSFELGKLYYIIGNSNAATPLLTQVKQSASILLANEANRMLTGAPQGATTNARVTSKDVRNFFAREIPVNEQTGTEDTNAIAALPTLQNNLSRVTFRFPMTPAELSIYLPMTIKPTAALSSKNNTTAVTHISKRDQMMNQYYELKNKKENARAYIQLQKMIAAFPNDVDALKEAGYFTLLTLKDNHLARDYFIRVYQLTRDPKIALQLGYICDDLQQKAEAYHYFDLATHTADAKDRMTAEISKTNLRGVQTKFLPKPYYATLDFSPLYMSRFKLLIFPIIFQIGRVINEAYQWKVYLSYRRTSDDRSNTTSVISNIFEDNAAIIAVGTQFTPIPKIPQLVALAEFGKATDLVYRNRARYRTDFRAGFAYYNEWGRQPEYTLSPTFMMHFNGDIYADAIYYNRYHDLISTMRFRPGFKLFRYGSTTLDVYYKGFVVQDQDRQFYNNLIETGPGFALVLSDRYNIVLRYEMLHGRYLPSSSPSANPYSMNYHNTVVELDTYFEF